MDRQAFIGIFLIMIVTLIWMFTMEPKRPQQTTNIYNDSTHVKNTTPTIDTLTESENIPPSQDNSAFTEVGSESSHTIPQSSIRSDSLEKIIYVENEFIRAAISSKNGGGLTHWELKKYDYFSGGQVDLIAGHGVPDVDTRGLNVAFVDKDGKNINLNDFNLSADWEDNTSVFLDENNTVSEIEFYLPIENGRIIKKYIFTHNKYSVDVLIGFENPESFIGSRWYTLIWENGLPSTEDNFREDFEYSRAYAYLGGELENLDVSDGENEKLEKSGRVDWTAIRSKYFLAAIVPQAKENLSTTLSGIGYEQGDAVLKIYNTSLGVNFPAQRTSVHVDSFMVYLGPLSISDLEPYGVDLEELVMNSSGYEGFFRPISRWFVLLPFTYLYEFIPNYGWVIIIFSILIKIILHPLTKKSYQSMGAMQTLQPKMTELREKYKNDPQRLNKEMMKLYKDEGINPLGGCLPMLLQMPLLFALFIVFRSTIQLRGEPFILWITDLSRPDTLALGFSIPFLGDSIHILPFLMGATMIWQSKMTITDPKQKPMMLIMPVFLTFIFYSFPSGLNLYYSVFNILSMAQTSIIKKKHPHMKEDNNKPAQKDKKSSSKTSIRQAISQISQSQKSSKKGKKYR